MSFLQPWMLVGLGTAILPIIIHLIFRRRPRRLPFPAIELLLRSAERVEQRWRLRRWLLLASRLAILALFCLAAARPFFPTEERAASTRGPTRRALVIDASLSMRAEYGGRTAFRRARERAIERVDAAGPQDQILIVRAGHRPELVHESSSVRSDLVRTIQDLEAEFRSADLGAAVTLAARSLAGAEEGVTSEIVVYSDFAEGSIRSAADLTAAGSEARPELILIDVVGDRDRSNTALTSLRVQAAPGAGPRTLAFEGRLRSFAAEGAPDVQTALRLRIDGDAQDETRLSLAAGTIVDHEVRHAFDAAGTRAVVLETTADRLPEDDRQFGHARIRKSVQALVVNGAPSGNPKEDETFYLEAALRAGAADQPPPRIVGADDLSRVSFETDVVILAGVTAVSGSDGERLQRFVEQGGGVLITVAEGLDPQALTSALGPLLPRPLRGLKRLGAELVGSSDSLSLRIASPEHPVVRVFQGEAVNGITSARTWGLVLLEPSAGDPLAPILTYDDGQPALLAHQWGRGRVLLWTSSIDRDLSDLSIRPGFVPLMRRSLLWLGRGLAPVTADRTLVGEAKPLRLPDGVERVRVVGPEGKARTVTGADGQATFRDTLRPGHYRVEIASQPENRDLDFAVNIDPSESDLAPMDPDDVQALLSGQGGQVTLASATTQLFDPRGIAGLLLALMAAAFVAEGLLSSRRLGR
jgi:hypothetical protein